MMTEGLLWCDRDPRRGLAEKVQCAADRYRLRFGADPDTCYVNPAALNGGPVEMSGVRLIARPNILPGDFWIGQDCPAEPGSKPASSIASGTWVCRQCGAEALDPQASACWACGYDGREK